MRSLNLSPIVYILSIATLGSHPITAEDSWTQLARLRVQLEQVSPAVADFEQTFVAAGFSSGDTETGKISLDLPACLRWDYGGEFPKSFLLCGHVAYAWNEGETSGRREFIPESEELSLELLRLDIEQLRGRYQAHPAKNQDGLTAIHLTPVAPAAELPVSPVRDATVWIQPQTQTLAGLDYHDIEGNLTQFRFGVYEGLPDTGPFNPPSAIEWLE